jgi:hypothetical protein
LVKLAIDGCITEGCAAAPLVASKIGSINNFPILMICLRSSVLPGFCPAIGKLQLRGVGFVVQIRHDMAAGEF